MLLVSANTQQHYCAMQQARSHILLVINVCVHQTLCMLLVSANTQQHYCARQQAWSHMLWVVDVCVYQTSPPPCPIQICVECKACHCTHLSVCWRAFVSLILNVVYALQSSLSGNGARISVICTVTPASSQAEETHNTLKFATRAKKIEITAQRNEIVDQASLIRRYQDEIQTLRSQLENVARERGGQMPFPAVHDPLHPEVCFQYDNHSSAGYC